MKEKYKIKIIPNGYQESNFPYDPGGTMICYLKFQLDTQQSIHIYITKFHQLKNYLHFKIYNKERRKIDA